MAEGGHHHKEEYGELPTQHVKVKVESDYKDQINDDDLEVAHNIHSLHFNDTHYSSTEDSKVSGSSHQVSNASNTKSFGFSFSNVHSSAERSNATMNYLSSGGFNVTTDSSGFQTNNSTNSLSPAKQVKTNASSSEICIESYNSFFSALVPTVAHSSTSSKQDHRKDSQSSYQDQTGSNKSLASKSGNVGDAGGKNYVYSQEKPSSTVLSANEDCQEWNKYKNLHSHDLLMHDTSSVSTVGSFGGGCIPYNCSEGFSYQPSYSEGTSRGSIFQSEGKSNSSQGISVMSGTDTGEFEPCLGSRNSCDVSNDDCSQNSHQQSENKVQSDRAAVREIASEVINEPYSAFSDISSKVDKNEEDSHRFVNEDQENSNYAYCDLGRGEKKYLPTMESNRIGNQDRESEVLNPSVNETKCAGSSPKMNKDKVLLTHDRKIGDFTENDMNTVSNECNTNTGSTEINTNVGSNEKNKNNKIFAALDNMISIMNYHKRSDWDKNNMTNVETETGDEAAKDSYGATAITHKKHGAKMLCSYSIVIDYAREKQRKTEMKADGEYQISAHTAALTIYDGLGGGRMPVMFNALMCIAPEDIMTFGVPFLNKLQSWGLSVFLPERDLNLTGPYHENLARALRERCNQKVIVIVSVNYPQSDECLFLTYYAKQLDPAAKRRSIIPVYIDKKIPNLPQVLSGLSHIPYNEAVRKGFLKGRIISALTTDTSRILRVL